MKNENLKREKVTVAFFQKTRVTVHLSLRDHLAERRRKIERTRKSRSLLLERSRVEGFVTLYGNPILWPFGDFGRKRMLCCPLAYQELYKN